MTGVGMPVGGRRWADYWLFPHFFNWSAHSVASDPVTSGTAAHQALLSMGFSRQDTGVGCHLPRQVIEHS